MSSFTQFPIPTRKANELPTISTLADNQHLVAATGDGFRRIVKTAVGFARIFVNNATPTGERTSQDFWIQPSESPAVMRWWNGADWQVTTYVPNKANLEALLELGDAATFDTGTDEGDIPVLSASGKLGTGLLPAITNALLATMPANTIKGRITTSGVPQDLTPTQIRSVAGLGTAATADTGFLNGRVPLVGAGNQLPASIIPSPFNPSTVVVRSLSDLPNVTSGFITLAANTTYLIAGSINFQQVTPVRLIAGNNSSIIGLDAANSVISYTGGSPFIIANNVNLFMKDVAIVSPNAPVFDWVSDGNNTFTSDFVSIIGGEVGTFFGGKNLSVFRGNWQQIDDGLTVVGNWDKVLLSQSVCETDQGTTGSIIRLSGSSVESIIVSGFPTQDAAGGTSPNGEFTRPGANWISDEWDFVWVSASSTWFLSHSPTGGDGNFRGTGGTIEGPWTATAWQDFIEDEAVPDALVTPLLNKIAVVSEAGNVAVKGNYTPVGTLNGRTRYRLGSTNYFIEFDFVWRIREGSSDVYTGSSATNPWDVVTWNTTFLGPAPVPTVSEGGAGGTLINDVDIFGNKFVSDTLTAIEIDDPDVVDFKATVINNRFRGAADFLDGVNFSTARWTLRDNSGVENTRITAHMWFTGNSTETTISTVDEWVKVGIATSANSLAGFTHTSPNKLTYTRDLPLSVKLLASLDVEAPSNDQRCEIAVFKNGTIVAATAREILLNTQDVSKSVTINARVEIEQDDEIELYIRNRTNDDNFIVRSLAVTI